jgi:nucleoside-diphosphate-sugar epimerase
VRDAASACRLALEANIAGHQAYYINTSRLLVATPIEQLLAKYYPGDYPVADHIRGDTCPFDNAKAARLLGWRPQFDWRGNPYEA